MAKVQVLIELGVLLGSFIFGILFYYFVTPATKEEKKEQIDLVSSQIINFVIFIWLGKILYHVKLFIQDPFAVLAYPSNSEAFYIATAIFVGTIAIQSYRKKISISSLVTVFTPVVIASSFLYEFIQMQFFQKNALIYLALLILLLFGYILLDKTAMNQSALIFTWAAGLLILSYLAPFIMIFQFLISRIFIIIVMIISLVSFGYYKRRKNN